MTLYPDGIDSDLELPNVPGTDGYVVTINATKEAVIAIETELGIDPHGAYSDVATRLSILESRVGPGPGVSGTIDINDANLTGVLNIARGGTALNAAGAANTVLTSNGTSLLYKLLTNSNISSSAALAVSKLAASSTDGYIITTVAGVTAWALPPVGNTITAPNWYINPTTGNDNNNGTTSGTALKTFAGLLKKWGAEPTLLAVPFITIHILGNLPFTDPIYFKDIYLGADTNLVISGEATTTVRSGSFTTVTALNQGGNIPNSVRDTAMSGTWTSNLGQRIRVTQAGAHLGQIAWVAKDLGSKTTRVNGWAKVDAPSAHGYNGPTPGSVSLGNTYVVEQLTTCYFDGIDNIGRVESTNTVHPGRVYFVDLAIQAGAGQGILKQCTSVGMLGCSIAGGLNILQASQPFFANCNFDSITVQDSGCSVLAGLCTEIIYCANGGNVYLGDNALVQAGFIDVDLGGNIDIGELGIFDAPTDAITLHDLDTSARITIALYGNNNTGFGVRLSGRSFITINSATAITSLTGTQGNYVLGVNTKGVWLTAGQQYVIADAVNGITITDTDWYIDPSTGSDDALGTLIGNPLKSYAELRRRWGLGAILKPAGNVATVHILASLPATDPISVTDLVLGQNVILSFVGTTTVSRSGTVSTVTTQNRSSNVPWDIIDSGLGGVWGDDIGYRLRVNSDTIIWPIKDMGGAQARVTFPYLASAAPGSEIVPTASVLTGATLYDVEVLPTITIDTINPSGAVGSSDTQFPRVTFFDLEIAASGVNYRGYSYLMGSCEIQFYGCHILANVVMASQSFAEGIIFSNCLFQTGFNFNETGFATMLGGGALDAGVFQRATGNLILDGDVLFQNTQVAIGLGGRLGVGLAAIFDVAGTGPSWSGAGILFQFGSSLEFDEHYFEGFWALWGSGNAGAGVWLEAGSQFLYESGYDALTLTGTSGDFLMAGSNVARFFDEGAGVYSTTIATDVGGWVSLAAAQPTGFGGSAHNVQADSHVLLIAGT